jgi:F-type H+-transporting ATPase subunit gamma
MPSLIDLRRRIRAVRSTQQITRAMKMIAASRLRRAQDRIINTRPFAQRMLHVLSRLVTQEDQSSHPLLRVPTPGEGRPLLIVITADRGLCGSFNSNIIKAASEFIAAENVADEIILGLVGRKGRDFFRRRAFDVCYERVGIFQKLVFNDAVKLADVATEEFVSGKASSVFLVYNEFKSVMSQQVIVEQLLPIQRFEEESEEQVIPSTDHLYEPTPREIFHDLLPRHVRVQVYRALLESAAAEHAARMTAMDAATRNSTEMIEDLTLYMNKVRQAAITREIIEVVSGAAAT